MVQNKLLGEMEYALTMSTISCQTVAFVVPSEMVCRFRITT